jgi:hypothetical protein
MTTTWQRDKERSRNGGKSGNSPREGASQDSGHATSIREASGVDAMFVDAERGLEMIQQIAHEEHIICTGIFRRTRTPAHSLKRTKGSFWIDGNHIVVISQKGQAAHLFLST